LSSNSHRNWRDNVLCGPKAVVGDVVSQPWHIEDDGIPPPERFCVVIDEQLEPVVSVFDIVDVA
jgi:hypothetical protein